MANSYAEIAQLQPDLQKSALSNETEKDRRKQELGILGSFLGFGVQATINVLNIVTIILVLFTCAYMLWGNDSGTITKASILDTAMPILTTLIGVILGKSNFLNKK